MQAAALIGAPRAERVLEAQVEKQASFARAWTRADGDADSRLDLQAISRVVRPADPRTEVERLRPLGLIGSRYGRVRDMEVADQAVRASQ